MAKQKPARRGRPSFSGGGESPTFRVRMPQGLIDKLIRLGGGRWVRQAVQEAKEPAK